MPSTYTLISSNVLSSSAASVTFSAIPSTYTDLVVRFSARTDQVGGFVQQVSVKINATSANYSLTWLYGQGTTAASLRTTSDTSLLRSAYANGAAATSNTFASNEIYIPNYTSSTNKPSSSFFVAEDNSAGNNIIGATANLWSNTSAITEVSFTPTASTNFVSGSSFYLYGIKKS